eukprot:gene30456-1680_t
MTRENTDDRAAARAKALGMLSAERQRAGASSTLAATPASFKGTLAFSQLNVNGRRNFKSPTLMQWLMQHKVKVAGFQEMHAAATKAENMPLYGTSLKGYHMYHSGYEREEETSHGVAIAVSRDLESWEYSPPTLHIVSICIATIQGPALFISIYVPTKAHRAKVTKVKEDCANLTERFRKTNPGCQVIILSDFNNTPEQFDKWMEDAEVGCTRHPTPATIPTHATGSYPIDFVASCNADVTAVKVITDVYLSDHHALLGSVEMEFQLPPKQHKRPKLAVDTKELLNDKSTKRAAFVGNKHWRDLHVLLLNDDDYMQLVTDDDATNEDGPGLLAAALFKTASHLLDSSLS